MIQQPCQAGKDLPADAAKRWLLRDQQRKRRPGSAEMDRFEVESLPWPEDFT
jgi:hypothetical protein